MDPKSANFRPKNCKFPIENSEIQKLNIQIPEISNPKMKDFKKLPISYPKF